MKRNILIVLMLAILCSQAGCRLIPSDTMWEVGFNHTWNRAVLLWNHIPSNIKEGDHIWLRYEYQNGNVEWQEDVVVETGPGVVVETPFEGTPIDYENLSRWTIFVDDNPYLGTNYLDPFSPGGYSVTPTGDIILGWHAMYHYLPPDLADGLVLNTKFYDGNEDFGGQCTVELIDLHQGIYTCTVPSNGQSVPANYRFAKHWTLEMI